MKAMHRIIDQARDLPMRIVLSEAEDTRVLQAAQRAHQEGIARIVLVGAKARAYQIADGAGIDLEGIELIDPSHSALSARFAEELFALREKKA